MACARGVGADKKGDRRMICPKAKDCEMITCPHRKRHYLNFNCGIYGCDKNKLRIAAGKCVSRVNK